MRRLGVAKLPYVVNTGKVPEYFNKIQEVGRPGTVNRQWLKTVGFTSSNDRYLVAFLRDIGFIDTSGNPTQLWTDYRDSSAARGILATALRDGFSELFQLYSDANQKDDAAVRNWMRTYSPDASPTTVDRSLATFRAVCALADFGPEGSRPASDAASVSSGQPSVSGAQPAAGIGSPALSAIVPSVNINVELHLPASADADHYEAFFSAMRKHLFDGPSAAD